MAHQPGIHTYETRSDGASPLLVKLSDTNEGISKVALTDGYGNQIESFKGGLTVHLGHGHNFPVNQFFYRETNDAGTAVSNQLASATNVDDRTITLDDATGFAVDDYIEINTTTTERTFPRITSIATNTLTLDRPLDFAHDAGDTVTVVSINMAVNGSVTPVSFKLKPIDGEVWLISRFTLVMVHDSQGDFSLFGNLTELPNGAVLRSRNSGQDGIFTVWKTNGEIDTDSNVKFDDRAGGQGLYSTSAKGSLLDLDRVQARLDGAAGDYLELIVQDDLTGLDLFQMKGQGLLEVA